MAASSTFDRERLVYIAKLAMQAKRYDEVIDAMEIVAQKMGALRANERNLLSEAYKIKIRSLRRSWGVLSRLMEIEFLGRENRHQINEYIDKVETEINGVCHQVLALLTQRLIPPVTTPVASVFYLKMLGDYCRYQAEVRTGLLRRVAVQRSSISYQSAMDIAGRYILRAHPLRLGLDLNFAVFNYEILNSADWACDITENTLFEAGSGLDRLNKKAYRESIKIMDLLWENTTLWRDEAEEDYWSEGEDRQNRMHFQLEIDSK